MIPEAFKRVQNQQKAAERAANLAAERRQAERDKKSDALYQAFSKALKPYDNCDLPSAVFNDPITYHIQINLDPNKREAHVFVDGYKYLTFGVEWNFGSCHCENACDCPPSEGWMTMPVTQHGGASNGGDYGCFFQCDQEHLGDEERFAAALDNMLKKFHWIEYNKKIK